MLFFKASKKIAVESLISKRSTIHYTCKLKIHCQNNLTKDLRFEGEKN